MGKSNYRQILTDVLAETCPRDMQTTSKNFIKSKFIVGFLPKNLMFTLMTIEEVAAAAQFIR